jgi:hypothetical protein
MLRAAEAGLLGDVAILVELCDVGFKLRDWRVAIGEQWRRRGRWKAL